LPFDILKIVLPKIARRTPITAKALPRSSVNSSTPSCHSNWMGSRLDVDVKGTIAGCARGAGDIKVNVVFDPTLPAFKI
jgi:hypothetical protein